MKTTVTLYKNDLEMLLELVKKENIRIYDERHDFHLNCDHLPHGEWTAKNIELEHKFSLGWQLANKIEEAYLRTFA